MIVKVEMFAAARDLVKERDVELRLPESATAGDLKQELVKRFPQLEEMVLRSALSVDHEYALDDTQLGENAEVALIPPVSGG